MNYKYTYFLILILISIFFLPVVSLATDNNIINQTSDDIINIELNSQNLNEDADNDTDTNNNNSNDNNDNDSNNTNDEFDPFAIDENDLFGDEDLVEEQDDTNTEDESILAPVYDLLNIGGRLEVSVPIVIGQSDDSDDPFKNVSLLGTPLSAVVYFNSRLNEVVRGYFEFDLSFTPSYYDGLFTEDWVAEKFEINLDEMFLDINANYLVFMRFGKQNVKWGAGYRWSPTDFINSERKDPLEPETDRNGITGIKVTVPIEPFNIITFFGLEGLKNILDTSITLRLELAYEIFELTGTVFVKKGKVPQYGLDFAIGAENFLGGSWDFVIESSFSWGSNKNFVAFDPDREGINPAWFIAHPDATEEEIMDYVLDHTKFYTTKKSNMPFFKVVGGISYTNTNTPDWLADMFVANIEYYYNGEGYGYPDKDDNGENINLIPYALLLNVMQEMGMHYLGASVIFTELFNADLTFNVNFIWNMTDLSSLLFVSLAFTGIDALSLSVYVKANFGEPGTEYYFASAVTSSSFIKHLLDMEDGIMDMETQEITGYYDVLREYLTIGIRMSIEF